MENSQGGFDKIRVEMINGTFVNFDANFDNLMRVLDRNTGNWLVINSRIAVRQNNIISITKEKTGEPYAK